MKNLKTYQEFISENLNEANEEVMATNAIQAVIFKVKKEFEPVLKDLEKAGFIKGYNLRVESYNRGYELNFNIKDNMGEWYMKIYGPEKNDNIRKDDANFIDRLVNNKSIYIYPDTWFEDKIEKNENPRIEGKYFDTTGDFAQYQLREEIKSRNDIKPRLKVIENNFMTQIKEIKSRVAEIIKAFK